MTCFKIRRYPYIVVLSIPVTGHCKLAGGIANLVHTGFIAHTSNRRSRHKLLFRVYASAACHCKMLREVYGVPSGISIQALPAVDHVVPIILPGVKRGLSWIVKCVSV